MRAPRSLYVFQVLFFGGLAASCKDKESPEGAAASARPESSKTSPVRLLPRATAIGQKWRAERKTSLSVSVEFWAEGEKWGTSESARKEEYSHTVEVLGLIGGSPGKVKVTYERYALDENQPDSPPRKDNHLQERTYWVDASRDEILVLDEAGKPVPEHEAKSVKPHFVTLGRDDPLVSKLGRRPIEVGKTFPLMEPLFQAFLGSVAGEYKSGSLLLRPPRRRGEAEVAPFEWSGELQTKEQTGMISDWQIKGTTEVAVVPARVLAHDIKGTVTVSGRSKKDGVWVRMEGDGSLSDVLAVTPLD